MFSGFGVQSAGGCSRALESANANTHVKTAITIDLVTDSPLGLEGDVSSLAVWPRPDSAPEDSTGKRLPQ
jgi:hypothetical protein